MSGPWDVRRSQIADSALSGSDSGMASRRGQISQFWVPVRTSWTAPAVVARLDR
jgi:hypothetical protein